MMNRRVTLWAQCSHRVASGGRMLRPKAWRCAAIPQPRDLSSQTPKVALYEGARLIGADPQNVGDFNTIASIPLS